MTVETLAQALYEGFANETGGLSIDGNLLPPFNELRDNPLHEKSYRALLVTASKAIQLIIAPKVMKDIEASRASSS